MVAVNIQNGIFSSHRGFFDGYGKTRERVAFEEAAVTGTIVPTFKVVAPTTKEQGGIRIIDEQALQVLTETFPRLTSGKDIESFIPAAGAATRLTQLLAVILNSPLLNQAKVYEDFCGKRDSLNTDSDEEAQLKGILDKELKPFWEQGIKERKFPFVKDLETKAAEKGFQLNRLISEGNIRQIASLIYEDLNYKRLPKLVMPAHYYPEKEDVRTFMEEHLRACISLQGRCEQVRVHFVISKEHQEVVDQTLRGIFAKPTFMDFLRSQQLSEASLFIDYSYQDPSTDSIVFDKENLQLVTDSSGNPVLRQSGHGALLGNLNNLRSGGIWINNVDATLYDCAPFNEMVLKYKQAMASLAYVHLDAVQNFKAKLNGNTTNEEFKQLETSITRYLKDNFSFQIKDGEFESKTPEFRKNFILSILNRPVVVAGFVPLADGLSGGGPFIVEDKVAGVTVQAPTILEGSELKGRYNGEMGKPEFFNPVLMFIARENEDGSQIDLASCRNPNRFLVTNKIDKHGRSIVFLEEGLWNNCLQGALHSYVALPCNVFRAVKTMSGSEGFLDPLHQPVSQDQRITLYTELDFRHGIVT